MTTVPTMTLRMNDHDMYEKALVNENRFRSQVG